MPAYDVFSWMLRHEDGRRSRIILIDSAAIHLRTVGSQTDVFAETYMDDLLARWAVLRETEILEQDGYALDSPVRVAQMSIVLSLLVAECQERGHVGMRLALVLEALRDAEVLT